MNPVVLSARIDILNVNMGTSIMLIGILGLLLMAATRFRNPAAAAAWGLSVIFLIMGSLFDLGAELFWISILGTIIILITGFLVRWAA